MMKDSTSSHNSRQTDVSRRFLFQYRSWGKELMVTLEGKSLNEVMLKFAKSYHDIDEVYEISEVDKNGG